MAKRTAGLDERILDSAYKEFTEYGYKDASINRIARNAGLTTGAIYVRYKDKDDLFTALVTPVITTFYSEAEKIKQQYHQLAASGSFTRLAEYDRAVFDFLTDFVFQHQELFTLLIYQSDGSSISNFKDDLIQMKTSQIETFIDSVLSAEAARGNVIDITVPREEIILLISAQYHVLFETLRLGYSADQARQYLEHLLPIFATGTRTLLAELSARLSHQPE